MAEGTMLTNRAAVVEAPNREKVLFYTGSGRVVTMLTSVPGSWFIPEKHTVGLPLTRETLLATEILGRIEQANDLYLQERARLLRPSERGRAAYPPTPPGLPPPMQHQIDAFGQALDTFAAGLRGFANWSEMGTGKTRFGIDLMRHLVKRYAIVIGQKITLFQWEDELRRTWPDAETIILQKDNERLTRRGERYQRTVAQQLEFLARYRKGQPYPERPMIFLINWETVARLVDGFLQLPRIDMVVADETSRIKNRAAAMSKAAIRLAQNCELRVAMSGTPMGNEPGDFWTQYRFLDGRIFGTSYWDFMRYYFLLGGWSGNEFAQLNSDRIIPFVTKLYSCAYRTTKAMIGDMPEKSYQRVNLTMEDEQAAIYEEVEEKLYAEMELEDGKRAALSVSSALARVTRLQQLTAGIFPINAMLVGEDENFENEGKTYRLIPSVKTEWTTRFVHEKLEDDPQAKIIIWSRFRPELGAIVAALRAGKRGLTSEDLGYIDGSTKDMRREELRKAFNDRNNPMRVLVCQIQAASHGLDLPAADFLIYHSNTFSYINRAQSEDRGHRLGRVRPYMIYDVVCRNSVDVQIMRAIEGKKDLSEMIMTPGFEREIAVAA